MALLAIIAVVVALATCISEDDDEIRAAAPPLTWEQLARIIDAQLGVVSDGTTATCEIPVGQHCKDQLQGELSRPMVAEYVAVNNDKILLDGDTVFWERGLPIDQNPCTRDDDDNGKLDYAEICISGGLLCHELGDNYYQLDYSECTWDDGDTIWYLGGQVIVSAYLTPRNEQVLIKNFKNFVGEGQGGNYVVNGRVVRYMRINALTGQPLVGTSGMSVDGMLIINVKARVDIDGLGNSPEVEYPIYFAYDFEDEVVLVSGMSGAVWFKDESPAGTLNFFDAIHPWDGSTGSCYVQIANVDDGTISANRTFDIVDSNCLDADTAIPF